MKIAKENEKRNADILGRHISDLEKEINNDKTVIEREEVICDLCKQVVGKDKIIHIHDHIKSKQETW